MKHHLRSMKIIFKTITALPLNKTCPQETPTINRQAYDSNSDLEAFSHN